MSDDRPHTEPPSNLDRLDWPGGGDYCLCDGTGCHRCYSGGAFDPTMHDIPEATFDRLPSDTPLLWDDPALHRKVTATDSRPPGWQWGQVPAHLDEGPWPREPRRYRLLWWLRKQRAKRGGAWPTGGRREQ